MARNEFCKFGARFWSEIHRRRSIVVATRKKSMSKYFDNKYREQDKSFWHTIYPFFSDTKLQNGNNNILCEYDNTQPV